MVHRVFSLDESVSNDSVEHVYGERMLSAADTEELIAPFQTTVPNLPSNAGEQLSVVSDTIGENGTVTLTGLDTNFEVITEQVTLNGQTPVNTVQSFTRLNDLSWEEDIDALGVISASAASGTLRQISQGNLLDDTASFTVPVNKKFTLEDLFFSIIRQSGGTESAFASIYVKSVISSVFIRVFRLSVSATGNSSIYYPNKIPLELEGPFDIYVSGTTTSTGGGTNVLCRLTTLLRQKP